MDIPTSIQAIVVIMVVFIPGYIFLTFLRQSVAFMSKEADARFFFAIIAWGSLIHAGAMKWSIQIYDWYMWGELRDHWEGITVWAVTVLGLVPFLAGVFASWLISRDWFDELILKPMNKDYVSRMESAWDFSIRTGGDAMLRIHLKDGTMIGGSYRKKAFAGSNGDIFLEDVYNLSEQGDFEDKVADTAGVWISATTISHILYFRRPVPPDVPSFTLSVGRRIKFWFEQRKAAVERKIKRFKLKINPEPLEIYTHRQGEERGQFYVRLRYSQKAATKMGQRGRAANGRTIRWRVGSKTKS